MPITFATLADPIHQLGADAETLVTQYFHRFMTEHGPAISMISPPGRPAVVIEMRAFQTHVVMYRDWATRIASDPSFAQIDPELQENVRSIAQECAVVLVEIDIEANADSKFQRISPAEREEVTAKTFVSEGAMDEIRARLRLQRRGEPIARFDATEHRVTRVQQNANQRPRP